MEKEFIAGAKKFHAFLLRELLLVLPLLRLKIVLKQTYVFLLLKEYLYDSNCTVLSLSLTFQLTAYSIQCLIVGNNAAVIDRTI